jgi:hypothetical protein
MIAPQLRASMLAVNGDDGFAIDSRIAYHSPTQRA